VTLWKSFGASVRGPEHITSGTVNQDAWSFFHHVWGDGIVISDGVGSKPLSNYGSHAACRAVECAALAFGDQTEINLDFLFNQIRESWLSTIRPLEPRDCSATCLFAFRLGDGVIHIGMLGDGLAAAIKSDGSVISLSEDKSRGFSNITVALSLSASAKDWQHLSLLEEDCVAVLLCTDGVADDLDNVDGFVKGVVDAHCSLAAVRANQHIRKMLENWPTPKHSDDKTIACLCREEISNG
jgi:serine/threonine protein phosphatase PrpC